MLFRSEKLAGSARQLPSGHVGPLLCRVYALDTTAGRLSAALGEGTILPAPEQAARTRVLLWIAHGNRGPYSRDNGRLYRIETYATLPAAGKPGIWQAFGLTLHYRGETVAPPRHLPKPQP